MKIWGGGGVTGGAMRKIADAGTVDLLVARVRLVLGE